jgi:hypothetical protein
LLSKSISQSAGSRTALAHGAGPSSSCSGSSLLRQTLLLVAGAGARYHPIPKGVCAPVHNRLTLLDGSRHTHDLPLLNDRTNHLPLDDGLHNATLHDRANHCSDHRPLDNLTNNRPWFDDAPLNRGSDDLSFNNTALHDRLDHTTLRDASLDDLTLDSRFVLLLDGDPAAGSRQFVLIVFDDAALDTRTIEFVFLIKRIPAPHLSLRSCQSSGPAQRECSQANKSHRNLQSLCGG